MNIFLRLYYKKYFLIYMEKIKLLKKKNSLYIRLKSTFVILAFYLLFKK